MKNCKKWSITGKTLILLILSGFTNLSFSQNTENTKAPSHFGGAVTVTNNGISFIPTFTLNKPAAIFDLSMGKRLTFEPQFRFALEGKPWSFIFWWRYKLIRSDRFRLTLGAHPAIAFRTITVTTDSVSQEIIMAQRYLAGELSPNYFITKNISIGMYYLYGRCFEEDAIRNTHFLTFNVNFSNIKLSNQFYMKFVPQIYYLNMDGSNGFYFTSSLTMARRNFPISISGLINTPFETEIQVNNSLIWNVSLIYSFGSNYARVE
jgi:hypothetical protein